MPHPKGHVKLSGDTHLPDAESDLAVEEGSSGLGALAKARTQPRGAATRVRRAGLLSAGEDAEAPATRSEPTGSPRRDAAVRRPPSGRAEPAPSRQPWAFWALAFLGAGLLVRALR